MDLTMSECRMILKTLPIGYYCGRSVPVTLDENEPTSFYSPTEDAIVISFQIIAQGLKNAPDNTDKESAIRAMLYHELSHAILTPKNIFDMKTGRLPNDILNIFEDERIETILNGYYMNVNFKQNLYNICGEKPTIDPTDPTSVFWALVRYRIGEPSLLRQVKRMIKTYTNLNNSSDSNMVWQYTWDIYDLYEKICNNTNSTSTNSTLDAQTLQQLLSQAEPGYSQERTDSQAKIYEKIKPICSNKLQDSTELNSAQIQQLTNAQQTIERLISNFNKKNSGGNGYNSYSGIFNPRALMRDDYKYFERSTTINGNNKYGTCHLNLVIDNSGSFSYNTKIVNSLLVMLSEIERKNPNFSMDVSFINEKFSTCHSIRDRVIHCASGNIIPDNLKAQMNALQKTNSYNYNIILFDGDACSAADTPFEVNSKLFKQLDMPQTTLITDYDNVKYMVKPFTKAKVIVTRHYTDELIKNIVIAFGRMFS